MRMYKEMVELETNRVKGYEQELKDLSEILKVKPSEGEYAWESSGKEGPASSSSWFSRTSPTAKGIKRKLSKEDMNADLWSRYVFLCKLIGDSQAKISAWSAKAKEASKKLS